MEETISYAYDRTRSTFAQILVTFALQTLNMNLAMILSMPVFVIGSLRTQTSSLALTEEQASWFGGMLFITQPLGSVFSGFLQESLSRKSCMIAVNFPQIAAWLILHFATSVTALFAGMALLGLSVGFLEAPVLAYMGEVNEPRLRGVFSTLGGIFSNVSFTIAVFIGAATHWRTLMLCGIVGPVISIITISMIPESPAWLVSKGRIEDAQRSYQWLRGWVSPKEVMAELQALVNYIRKTQGGHDVDVEDGFGIASIKEEGIREHQGPSESKLKTFLHPSIQRPLRLIVIYFSLAHFANLSALKPFFVEVVKDMNLPLSTNSVLRLGSLLTLVGAITATLTVRRLGKRGLTFLSLGLCVFCCLGLSLYQAKGMQIPWIPFLLFNLSSYASALGISFIPWVLTVELFPLKGRGVATGVAAASCYLGIFVVVKSYFNIVSFVGLSGACFLYGSVGLLGFVYLYYSLPETEGVSLEAIEGFFVKDNEIKMNDLERVVESTLTTPAQVKGTLKVEKV